MMNSSIKITPVCYQGFTVTVQSGIIMRPNNPKVETNLANRTGWCVGGEQIFLDGRSQEGCSILNLNTFHMNEEVLI